MNKAKGKGFVVCALILLFLSVASGQSQKRGSEARMETTVARDGGSSLGTEINGIPVQIAIAQYQIDIGKKEEPPAERKNNCTYSSFPCSQVSSLRIRVKGISLFVPRSVFADCADVGNMRLALEGGDYVLTLTGGDASEAYSVKVFFNANQVKKREVYDLESGSMRQSTTYMPPPVLE
jgi:hypothetical protein